MLTEDLEREALKDQIYLRDFEPEILLEIGEPREATTDSPKIGVKNEETFQYQLLPF